MNVSSNGLGPGSMSTPKGVRAKSKCSCRRAEHQRREAISRSLKLIRTRFSIPNGELPELEVGDLGNYLSGLQNPGRPRPSIPFPRRQESSSSEFPSLSRLGRQERWELALSVSSIKRGLRADPCKLHPPGSMKQEWFRRSCQPSPPRPSQTYLDFVRRIIRKEFRLGWDSSYESFVQSFIPKDSSRAEGGNVGALDRWRDGRSYEEWQSALRSPPAIAPLWELRYKEVPTVGKVRAMGIPSSSWDYLGPLHKSMYQYMSTRDWLLRGSPNSNRIRRTARGHTWFTSVDLVAATDGLSVEVAEAILGVVLGKSSHIPGHVRMMAAQSLRPICEGQELTYGQNMGTYLSFPLLCLQSYCAARWASRSTRASFLVNGDDTVIFSDRPILKEDYPEGFQLNDSKTVRSKTLVELNSTVFLLCGRKWREVKSLRRGASYPCVSGAIHLSAVCQQAGKRWVDALARSKLLKSWDPKELGLDPTATPSTWHWYQKRKRLGGRVIVREDPPSVRFDLSTEEPTSGDIYAFRKDLFEGGRGGIKRGMSVKEGKKMGGTVVRYRFLLSDIPWTRAVKERGPRLKKGRVYLYSASAFRVEDYWDTQEEKEKMRFWLP